MGCCFYDGTMLSEEQLQDCFKQKAFFPEMKGKKNQNDSSEKESSEESCSEEENEKSYNEEESFDSVRSPAKKSIGDEADIPEEEGEIPVAIKYHFDFEKSLPAPKLIKGNLGSFIKDQIFFSSNF